MKKFQLAAGLLPLAFLCQTAHASNSFAACSSPAAFSDLETSGCEQGDKIFSGFSYFANSGAPPPAANIDLNFSGSDPAGPITDTFSASDWLNQTASSSVFLYNSTQVDQTLDPGFVITGFDLSGVSTSYTGACSGSSGCGVQLIVDICTNDTTTCTSTDPNWGQIDYTESGAAAGSATFCYNGNPATLCSSGASSGASISFDVFLDVTSIFVTNWVIVDSNGGDVNLNSFANDSFEALGSVPEPGTLGLLGSALTGLVFLKRLVLKR